MDEKNHYTIYIMELITNIFCNSASMRQVNQFEIQW